MKKVTIKDIAQEANVSTSTVSFVLNNKGEMMGISAAVIKKVQDIVEAKQYKPSMIASSLRTGKTSAIGLIVEDISNPFFAEMARVIEDEAKKKNYRVFYCSTGNDDARANELVRSLLQANVDGFIITPTENTEGLIDDLLKMNKPVVLIDRYFPGQNVSHVVMDNYEGAYEATHCLIRKGHQNIALVSTSSQMVQMQLRELGYKEAIDIIGKYNTELIHLVDLNDEEETRVEKMKVFFDAHPEITSVLFLANYLTLSGLKALRSLKKQIPSEVGVISFDEHDIFKFHQPTIAVMAQPVSKMANEAVEILISQIQSKEQSEVKQVMMKGDLILRESIMI